MTPALIEPELRVILVGPTGLDAALRSDPTIEIIRSRTPMDAIGELADPFDDTNPARSVVIVAPDGDKSDPSQVRQFIDGLRLIDPHVRVLRVANAGTTGASSPFDAELRKDAAPDDLIAAIRGTPRQSEAPRAPLLPAGSPGPNSAPSAIAPSAPTPPTSPPPASTPSGPSSTPPDSTALPATVEGASAGASGPGTTPPPAPGPRPLPRIEAEPPAQVLERKPARPGVGDETLASEIIRGRDALPPALEILRARLGGRRVDLLNADTPTSPAPDATRVPVRWGDVEFGLLEADAIAPADLQRHADWLASWLRLAQQHAELREAAYRDPLTGAWNRRYFDRFLPAALAKSRDGRHALTLLVFDIDDFKLYNDRYGHAAGDDILIETTRLIQATVRPTDRVCRIGGDEFAVIFYEPTGPRETGSRHPTSFFDLAKRFQKQVWEQRFPKLGMEAPGTLTISGGLATFPWDGSTAEELLAKADKLALDSKRLGKNAITLGPGAMKVCGQDGKR